MKALCIVTAVAVALSSPAQSQAPPLASPAPKLCTISGMVVATQGGLPIRKAAVALIPEDMTHADDIDKYAVVTDAEGHFQIADVAPGKYKLRADRTGFLAREYGQRQHANQGMVLTLTAGQELSGVLLRLMQPAAISGRVLDEDGDPMSGVEVRALQYHYGLGRRALAPAGSGSTDERGEYRIYDLPPGRYYVLAEPRSEPPVHSTSGEETRYAPTFYPNAFDEKQATALDLRAGDEANVSLSLARAPTVHARGKLFGLPPGSRAGVAMTLRGGEGFESSSQNEVRKDGSFDIDGLVPGTYLLVAAAEGEDSNERNQPIMHNQVVKVGPAGVDGLQVFLGHHGKTIRGMVHVAEPGANAKLEQLYLMLADANGDNDADAADAFIAGGDVIQGGASAHTASVNPNGSFEFTHVPQGDYVVQAFARSESLRDYFAKSVRIGNRDVTDTGFRVGNGMTNLNMDVTISVASAAVEGVALDEKGKPAAGVTVVAVPSKQRRRRWDLYMPTTTDQNGKFQIQGINPGQYTFFAWDDIDENAYTDPDFLKAFEPSGQTVTLEERGHRSLKLAVLHSDAN